MTSLPEGWSYNRLRQELSCPHGVGHPAPWSEKQVHGCDGCCAASPGGKHEDWQEALEVVKEKTGDEG